MNLLVIYKSKTGASAKYASIIASSLGVEAIPLSFVSAEAYSHADIVVYCGGLYFSRINGIKKLLRYSPKPLYIFASCINLPDGENIEKIRSKNRLPENSYLYTGRGMMNTAELGSIDKFLVKGVIFRTEKKKILSPAEKEFLHTLKFPTDLTSPVYTIPLLKDIRSLAVR